MYDDDMLIMLRHENIDAMYTDVQNKLNSVVKLCDHNKFTINLNKMKFMLVSSTNVSTNRKVHTGTESLATLKNYEYLGMVMGNKLDMSHHVDNMYKKANTKLSILCKIRCFILEKRAVRIYKTMIRRHIEYIDFVIESSNKESIY